MSKAKFTSGNERHVVYKKTTKRGEGKIGDIMVNHPTKDKGTYDTISLTRTSNAKTIKQGIAAEKKWHADNAYKKEKKYFSGTKELNDPLIPGNTTQYAPNENFFTDTQSSASNNNSTIDFGGKKGTVQNTTLNTFSTNKIFSSNSSRNYRDDFFNNFDKDMFFNQRINPMRQMENITKRSSIPYNYRKYKNNVFDKDFSEETLFQKPNIDIPEPLTPKTPKFSINQSTTTNSVKPVDNISAKPKSGFAQYPNMNKQGFFDRMKNKFGGLMQNRTVNGRDVNNISVTGPSFVSGAKSVKQYRGDENLPEAKKGMKNCGCKHPKVSKYKYQDGSNNVTSNNVIPVNNRKKNIMKFFHDRELLNKYGYDEGFFEDEEEETQEKNNSVKEKIAEKAKKVVKEFKKKSSVHSTSAKFFKFDNGTKKIYIPFSEMQPSQQNEYRTGMQKDEDFTVTNIGRYARPTKAQKELSAKMDAKYKAAAAKKNSTVKPVVATQKPTVRPTAPTQVQPKPVSKIVAPVQAKPTAPVVNPVVTPPKGESWSENQWKDFLKKKNNVPYVKPTPYIPVAKTKPATAQITAPKTKQATGVFLDPKSKGVLKNQQGPIPTPKPIASFKDAFYNFPALKTKARKVAQAPIENTVEEPSIIDSVLETIDGLISGGQRLVQKTQKENPKSINNAKIVDEDTIPNKNTTTKVDSLPVNYGYKEFKAYADPYSDNPTDSLVSFRNVFDNDSGAEYVIGHKVNEVTKAGAKKRFNNVRGVAHFLRDSDILPGQKITPKNWTTTKGDKYETTSPGKTVSAPDLQHMDRYRMVYKPIPGTDKYKTKYIKPGSQEVLRQLEKEGWETDFTVSGQHKFSDIDWDKEGKKTGYKGVFDETRWVPLKNGEFTHIPYKDKGSFSRFSGGSVTYLFKHPVTGKSIGADFAGSVNDMKDYGNKLIQKYKLNPQDLEVVYHDMGSYSAKPKAKKGTLDYDQWTGYNNYNKGFSGAPLIIPNYKYGTGALTIPEGSAIVTANKGKNKQALMAYKKGNYKLLNKIIDDMPEDNVNKKQGGVDDLKARYQYLAGLTGPLSEEQRKELDNIKTELTKPSYDLYDDKRIAEKFGQKYDVDKANWRSSLQNGNLNLKEDSENTKYRNRLRNEPAYLEEQIKEGNVTIDKNGNIAYKSVGKSAPGKMEFLGTSKAGTLPDLPPEGPATIPGKTSTVIPPPKTPPGKKGYDFPSMAEVAARSSLLAQGVEGVPENYLKLGRYNYASQLPQTLREIQLSEQAGRETARDVVAGDAGRYLAQAGSLSASRMKAANEAVVQDTLARQDILNKNVDLGNREAEVNTGLKNQFAQQRSANRGAYNNQLIATGQSIDTAVDTSKLMKSQRNVDDVRTNLLKTGEYTMDSQGNIKKIAKGSKKLKTYKRK